MAATSVRVALLLQFALAGCSAAPSAPDVIYMETGQRAWLTPDQRRNMQCRDGQPLECRYALGRTSPAWCDCPPVP
jgi:hypothetical protein